MSEIPILLSKFPGRIQLTLHKCTFPPRWASATNYRKVCNATSLHVSSWTSAKTIQHIFETFTFPHLTSLKLTGTEPENDVSQYMDEMKLVVEVLRVGLEQCPVLTELKLVDVGIFASDLLDILCRMKRLTSLSFIEPKKCFPWHWTLKTCLVKELKESSKESVLLPLLEELELVWSGELGVDEDEMMDMVESLATFGKLVKVVIGGRDGVDIRPVTGDRMKKLREKGVDATLW